MSKKTQPGRADRYFFTLNSKGRELLYNLKLSFNSQDIATEESEETIEGTTLLVLTVTGKRPGEGRISADMKARKS